MRTLLSRDHGENGGVSSAVRLFISRGELKKSAIPGILTQAKNIGQTLRLARQSGSNPIQVITQALNSYVIASGKIVDVQRQTSGGFARGDVVIECMRDEKGKHFTVLFQNELLLTYRSSTTRGNPRRRIC
ncbi:MAG: S-methyl thiohydantoin desulfurase domain-containing protein [Candidatus Malihini olakiniferum]